MPYKVLVAALAVSPNSRAGEMLVGAGLEAVRVPPSEAAKEDNLLRVVGDVDAYIAANERVSGRVIAAAPKLKVISRVGVGYDSVDLKAATERGIPVTITPGTNHHSVADLVLGLMLALARDLVASDQLMRQGKWVERKTGAELGDNVLGIIGLGRVGKQVALRAKAFAMQVIANDILPDHQWAQQHGVPLVSFEELLQRSDFVSLNCAATKENHHFINRGTLALMKKTAFLINTARGELVEGGDLLQALRERTIAGAAIDVYEVEPNYNTPLAAVDNVLLTPHLGAWTREAIVRMAVGSVQNVLDVLAGKRPDTVVNPEVYA